MFKMTPEPKGWILGTGWGLRAFATYWINGLKMIMTKDVNKITRLMGLIIMQVSKNFKSKRLLGIFGRLNGILKTFVKHMINWGWADTRQVRGIIRRGIHVVKNCKAVSSKDSRDNREYFGTSCNNKINGEWLYEWQVYADFIGVDGGRKSQMRCHKDSREHRRVNSESSSASGDRLKWGALQEKVLSRT